MGGATKYDAIVIGGGPAGATLATRLAQQGRRALVVEREDFPRFHIGESLLPCSMPLLDALGVPPDLLRSKFLPKHAAEFVTGDGSLVRRYPFKDGVVSGPNSAFEVDRDEFDSILLQNAARAGATVRHATKVVDFDVRSDGVRVEARARDGSTQTFRAEVLVDASGHSSLVARRFGLREVDPNLKNFAVYSHYRGATRATGDAEGDISIVLAPRGWWWIIPLKNNRTSLGLVAPVATLAGERADTTYLERQIARTPYLAARVASAERIEPVRTVSNFSYRSSRMTGDRWLLVGDAAAFIDPVFSTGVYVGMRQGFLAAEVIDRALARQRFSRRAFRDYERWSRRALDVYRNFATGFYTPEFAEMMMHPSDTLQLRQAVTSLLAGYVVDHFGVNWRIALFRSLIRANKYWRLTPRLPGRREAAEAWRAGHGGASAPTQRRGQEGGPT